MQYDSTAAQNTASKMTINLHQHLSKSSIFYSNVYECSVYCRAAVSHCISFSLMANRPATECRVRIQTRPRLLSYRFGHVATLHTGSPESSLLTRS